MRGDYSFMDRLKLDTSIAMTNSSVPQTIQKLSTIWSSRREKEIAVKIEYQKWEEGGCQMFCLSRVEEQ